MIKNEVVVTLKSNDRVENLLPYLEKNLQPGARVVFVIPCPVDGLDRIDSIN